MKRLSRFFLWGAVFVIGMFSGFYLKSFFVLDSCLDAGGVWDEQFKTCVYNEEAILELNIRLGRDKENCITNKGH